MSISTTGTLKTDLTWSQVDTGDGENSTRDTVSIGETLALADGTGEGQIDTVWMGTSSLGAGVIDTIDLYNLERLIFGGSLSVSYSGGDIKTLVVENTSTGNNQFISVANTGVNNLTHYSNGAGCSIKVWPKNVFTVSNQYSGYSVDDTNRYVQIVDGGFGSTYKIGVAGVN